MEQGRETGEERLDGPAEFEEALRDRQLFDRASWSASLAARREMPVWHSGVLAPEVARQFVDGVTEAMVVHEWGLAGEVRLAEPMVAAEVELCVVDVDLEVSDAGPMPSSGGVLAVPVGRGGLRDLDPRSLALHHWDADAEEYDLLPDSVFDLAGGYVYAHVFRSGRYSVLGLPIGKALGAANQGPGGPLLQKLLYTLILRVFDPTGPWTSLGPVNLSCCITDVAIDPATPDRIFAAASDGGVWRLDSVANYPGQTWKPVTEGQHTLQIQCVAVSPADSTVVYYVDAAGQLHRSADRGDHWTAPSATSVGYARRLLAHPTDANTVFVATSTGLWCTHDGGVSWVHGPGRATLLDGDIQDVALDPASPAIIYAAPANVGLRKSSDGGATWTTVLPWSKATAPAGPAIRIGVGGQGTDATRTVAVRLDQEVFVNRKGGRDVGMSGGGPWTSRGQLGGTGYGSWCHVIAVDPFDDDVILTGGQQLYRSADGGASWALVINYYAPHEDQHRVLFDPTNPGVVYAANDGGLFRSANGGATWQVDSADVANRLDLTHGLVTAQYYTAAVSGDHALGNLYHQGIVAADSLRTGQWENVEGHSWEFQSVAGDPVRNGTYYVFNGVLFRRAFPGPAVVAISTFNPTALAVTGSGRLLVAATDGLIRSTTDPLAASPIWTTMPGLSSPMDNVAAIATAPSQPERAYAVTAGGKVFACADASISSAWTAKAPIPTPWPVALAVAADDASVVFVATSTTVYRSANGGGSWMAVNGTGATALPPGTALRSLVAGNGAVYACAAAGVFTSADRGGHWYDFSAGLPNVELKQLLWTESDLFAVTHGRGIWHHGRYDIHQVPGPGTFAHKPDLAWLIELWHRIHGGDPGPDAIRHAVGHKARPFRKFNNARR